MGKTHSNWRYGSDDDTQINFCIAFFFYRKSIFFAFPVIILFWCDMFADLRVEFRLRLCAMKRQKLRAKKEAKVEFRPYNPQI